jgi:hypothetical protein
MCRLKEINITNNMGAQNMLCDMILMVAVGHAAVADCCKFVEEMVSKRSMASSHLPQIVREVLRPLQCCGGENWAAPRRTVHCPSPGGSENVRLPGQGSSDSTPQLQFSPNVLSLFLGKSLFPLNALSSPPVNHRPLHLQRVWSGKAIKTTQNPGMIGSLLRLQKSLEDGISEYDTSLHDASFSAMAYTILPYKVVEKCLGTSTPDCATNEYVFAHEKNSAPGHYPEHVSLDDLKNLITLVAKKVSTHRGFLLVNQLRFPNPLGMC